MNDTYLEAEKNRGWELRESRLWWLAVLIIALLSLTLFVIDVSNNHEGWWFSSKLRFALNTKVMRASLLIATLLICAYFRDSAKRLRRENWELINSLQSYGRILEKKNREITRLKDLSDQLIGVTDLQVALDLVLEMAVQVIEADTASIMLRDKKQDTLRIVSSYGLPSRVVRNSRVKISNSLAGIVIAEGKALLLNSDDLNPKTSARAHRTDIILSSVIVPIQVEDQICGVINIAKRRGGDCFTEEDMGVLSTLANQTSMVIQKAELLDNLKAQIEMLASAVEELKQTQASLIQTEKLASIGQLAGGVAHEINNPLQVVKGRVELLLMSEKDEANAHHLHSVLEHTNRISDIVSNLLSFSRQSSNTKLQELDINSVLEKTLSLLEPQMFSDNVEVVREFDPGLSTVIGNAGQLQQVFTNLALNAYQAMRSQQGGTVVVRSRPDGEMIVIEFRDNGPGVPPDIIEKIFEPFFTTKEEGEGTGLGLSIAYGIVQAHGGRLQAENNPEGGACFTITLPLEPPALTGESN